MFKGLKRVLIRVLIQYFLPLLQYLAVSCRNCGKHMAVMRWRANRPRVKLT
jgi:hypothetical protein